MKNYKIFQLDKSCEDYRYKIFSPLSFLDKAPTRKDYVELYNGFVEGVDEMEICEWVFANFNLNTPKDFKGHSMSVSDVVVVEGKAYYCDDYGFVALSEF